MPKEEFRRDVEKELTGVDEGPAEPIFFKVYKRQVISDRAGSRPRACCWDRINHVAIVRKMICADFLAGVRGRFCNETTGAARPAQRATSLQLAIHIDWSSKRQGLPPFYHASTWIKSL